jgi:adenine-specific DNA-methyltransferase
MHAKSEQVTRFLETNLPAIITAALGDTDETRRKELLNAWQNERQMAITYGAPDPDTLPRVKEARTRYDAAAVSAALEAQIYDHLYRFFERYYEDGDFVSRRYFVRESATRSAPYAVPYSGEEVKLVRQTAPPTRHCASTL